MKSVFFCMVDGCCLRCFWNLFHSIRIPRHSGRFPWDLFLSFSLVASFSHSAMAENKKKVAVGGMGDLGDNICLVVAASL